MAKRRRGDRGERGLTTPSTASFELELLRAARLVSPVSLEPIRSLISIEDRRLFHPARELQPARSTRRKSDADVGVRARARSDIDRANRLSSSALRVGANSFGVGFRTPGSVVVCVRRKRRKEVLFAQRKTGAGARSPRRRRNAYSDVSC